MTEIQILNTKRNASYLEISYKMTFTLPAAFGTGSNPVVGLDKILASYGIYSSEVIPVVGTVITLNETTSILSSLTLPQIESGLQARYAAVRTILDGLTLSPTDNLAGLSWDGATWFSSATVTDIATDQTLCVTATAAAAAAVTLTLPAVPQKFHKIVFIEITAYSSSARTGAATPIIVTTTNLSGSPAFTFATAANIGTTDSKIIDQDIKSLVANTATTIVCPATTGVIWRINCFYNLST